MPCHDLTAAVGVKKYNAIASTYCCRMVAAVVDMCFALAEGHMHVRAVSVLSDDVTADFDDLRGNRGVLLPAANERDKCEAERDLHWQHLDLLPAATGV